MLKLKEMSHIASFKDTISAKGNILENIFVYMG